MTKNLYLRFEPRLNKRNGWYKKIPYFKGKWYKETLQKIKDLGPDVEVFPHPEKIFDPFNKCHWNQAKVFIFSTQPAPNNISGGLGFMSRAKKSHRMPLYFFLKVLKEEVPEIRLRGCDVSEWSNNGIFNGYCILTTDKEPALHTNLNHHDFGWYFLNWMIARAVSYEKEKAVIILMGPLAKKLGKWFDNPDHLVFYIPISICNNEHHLDQLRKLKVFTRSATYLGIPASKLWRL